MAGPTDESACVAGPDALRQTPKSVTTKVLLGAFHERVHGQTECHVRLPLPRFRFSLPAKYA